MKRIYYIGKVLIWIICAIFLINMTPAFATTTSIEKIVIAEEVYYYESDDLQMKSLELVNKYSDLLTYEKIGESVLHNDIYVIKLTDKKQPDEHNQYAKKMDLFIESGTHARETVNPYFVLNMIEDYCIDYYDDHYIEDIDAHDLLGKSVLHFVPLTNPDGFDFAKYGLSTIDNPMVKKFIEEMMIDDPGIYKSNIRGVDLNRNYEDIYFDLDENIWVDQFGKNKENLSSSQPSPYHYRGMYPASEPEIQAMQDYMMKYPFRGYISFHSMGEAIYYQKPHFSENINDTYIYPYAQLVSKYTGYMIQAGLPKGYGGDGFFSHYGFNNTLKPSLTVETTSELYFPIKYEHYKDYKKVYLVPAKFMEKAHDTGYYEYKVYVDHVFYQDYPIEAYANAVAEKMGGQVEKYHGTPRLNNTFTRSEIVKLDDNYYLNTKLINYFSWKVEEQVLKKVSNMEK